MSETRDETKQAFHSTGEVRLAGCFVGGPLYCAGAKFDNPVGFTIRMDHSFFSNNVFLSDGFSSIGTVDLSGAKILGQLCCADARFSNEDGDALVMQSTSIGQGFVFRRVNVLSGGVDLTSAHTSDLVDDLQSWPDGRLILNGFTYDRISAAFTDADTRIEWLRKGDRWKGEFFPQPYNQLAKVLREMGHDRAARTVRMKQEQLVRQHIRESSRIVRNGGVGIALKSLWADGRNLIRWVWDIVLRVVTGYGHEPVRSVIALIVLFLIATSLANCAWNEGSFAPNSGPILVSSGWTDLADDTTIVNPAEAWSAKGAPGQDWETFNRYAYGFDVVVPILTLGQTDAWAPSTTRGWWGRQLWWARWVLSSFGWIVTALGAAAITGIIRRE